MDNELEKLDANILRLCNEIDSNEVAKCMISHSLREKLNEWIDKTYNGADRFKNCDYYGYCTELKKLCGGLRAIIGNYKCSKRESIKDALMSFPDCNIGSLDKICAGNKFNSRSQECDVIILKIGECRMQGMTFNQCKEIVNPMIKTIGSKNEDTKSIEFNINHPTGITDSIANVITGMLVGNDHEYLRETMFYCINDRCIYYLEGSTRLLVQVDREWLNKTYENYIHIILSNMNMYSCIVSYDACNIFGADVIVNGIAYLPTGKLVIYEPPKIEL